MAPTNSRLGGYPGQAQVEDDSPDVQHAANLGGQRGAPALSTWRQPGARQLSCPSELKPTRQGELGIIQSADTSKQNKTKQKIRKNAITRGKCSEAGGKAGGCSLWDKLHSPSRPSPIRSGRAPARGLCPAPPLPPPARPPAGHCSAAGRTPAHGGGLGQAVGTRGRQMRADRAEGSRPSPGQGGGGVCVQARGELWLSTRLERAGLSLWLLAPSRGYARQHGTSYSTKKQETKCHATDTSQEPVARPGDAGDASGTAEPHLTLRMECRSASEGLLLPVSPTPLLLA